MTTDYTFKIHSSMAQIPAEQWDRLVKDRNPFISHAFLHALEAHRCVSEDFGWHPQHIAIYDQEKLVAAMPVYEKHNNYGEFVFDQAWEQAWSQVGLAYYPKLISAAPFTPVQGQRLLVDETHEKATEKTLQQMLLAAITGLCDQKEMSGAHILFADKGQQTWLQSQPDWLSRHDCQFHWFNQNYQDFDDFLSRLSAKKRKNIIQERKAVKNAGVSFRILNGHTAQAEDWQQFAHFYQKTFIEKWSTPTLNLGFFQQIAHTIPEQIVLVLADQNGHCIAGALMFQSDTHLYGRHWGCSDEVKHLHFETCFYQGIDYAIRQGLQVFEPGAGGEHKIARGFVPVAMQSAHWLRVNPFVNAIDQFIEQEKQAVDHYSQACLAHAPYKETDCFYR